MDDYFEERVKKQREWYEQRANYNKKIFFNYQTIIIVLGAIIPVLVALETTDFFKECLKEWGGPLAAIISANISIFAGLDKLRQPQPNWFNYRANEEMIKKEEWLHKYKGGPYRGLEQDQANPLLVERIESIISADIARMTNIEDRTKMKITEDEKNPKGQQRAEEGQ